METFVPVLVPALASYKNVGNSFNFSPLVFSTAYKCVTFSIYSVTKIK